MSDVSEDDTICFVELVSFFGMLLSCPGVGAPGRFFSLLNLFYNTRGNVNVILRKQSTAASSLCAMLFFIYIVKHTKVKETAKAIYAVYGFIREIV